MKPGLQIIVVALLLIASASGGYFFYQATQTWNREKATRPPVLVADPVALEKFALEDLEGTVHRLTQWTGQPQIINYWATWCPPCREEIPLLVSLQAQYAQDDLAIIGLSMDFPEDLGKVKQFVAEQGINYPVLMAVDSGNELATVYGARNFVLPISIFVRADGTVSHTHTGMLTKEQATRYLVDTL